MSCGSCAAFAATGLHETCMAMAGAPMKGLDLAEQFLVDCGYNNGTMKGCVGAEPHSYTVLLLKKGKGRSPHEGHMPYRDRNPALKCPKDLKFWNSGAKVRRILYDYECDAEKMKKLVAKYGAVMTALHAADIGFSNLNEGVYENCP